jgi:hypothetical protein
MFWGRLLFVIFLGILFSLCACQKEASDEVLLVEPSEPVILTVDVYNHTQGFLTKIKRSQKPDSRVRIKLADLGVEGVDKDRMVMREHRFGVRVAFSQTGSIHFDAPKNSKNYTLYLLNASNGADYRMVDTWTSANEGVLEYVPPIKWYREDRNNHRGPEGFIIDVIDQLNEALEYPWASYGRFQRIEERENSSFGVGYGYCRNQFGWHNPYWAGVNPDHCLSGGMKQGTFIEEIFELLTRLNDIGGKDTASLITDPDTGDLNGLGKDLLAYVFVKDEKI